MRLPAVRRASAGWMARSLIIQRLCLGGRRSRARSFRAGSGVAWLAFASVALAGAVTQAGAAGTTAFPGFRTPSGNIQCLYHSLGTRGPAIRCDIRSELSPKPQRSCDLDWVGVSLPSRGPASPTCAGDTVFFPPKPQLPYGRTWSRGWIACVSRTTGLTCRSGRHGFFLSREKWRTW